MSSVPGSDDASSPLRLASGDVESTTTRPRFLAARELVKRNVGLLLILAAQAFFSLMNAFVKKLQAIDPPVSTFELILVRMVMTFICSAAYMIVMGVPHPFLGPNGVRLLLWLRGSAGFFRLLCAYYSLKYLSLSDATVLTFLAPLTTGITGFILLGESFTIKQAFASLVSLVGVVLIARPNFLFGISETNTGDSSGTPKQRLVAVGVALIGVCGMTGAYVAIRAIGKRAHPLHAVAALSIQSIIGSSLGMLILGTSFIIPTQWVWLGCLVMIGIFGFLGQLLLTMGLQREKVARGTMAVYSQMVYAVVFELMFFGTLPSALSAIGASIIISAALYVALSKQPRKTQPSVSDEETPEAGQPRDSDSDDEEDTSSQRHHEVTALLGPNTNRS